MVVLSKVKVKVGDYESCKGLVDLYKDAVSLHRRFMELGPSLKEELGTLAMIPKTSPLWDEILGSIEGDFANLNCTKFRQLDEAVRSLMREAGR
jgi:hypothetical protein